jgi:two-component system cell cycle response regulator CtrA
MLRHWLAREGQLSGCLHGLESFAMRTLLIEDDRAMRTGLEMILGAEKIMVDVADLGEDGLELARLGEYDAVLLDLSLPDMSGHEVLRRLRAASDGVPVIILSGESSPEAKVKALTAGADDYITKPCHRDELTARLRAVVRRSQGRAQAELKIGKLSIDLEAKSVRAGDQRLSLTGKEYEILELLATRRGAVVTKDMILAHVYGGRDEPEIKIVDVFICKLRKKLISACGEACIETVWGRGYTIAKAEADEHAPLLAA